MALLLALACVVEAGERAAVSVDAYFDPPYLIEEIRVRAPPLTSLAINLTKHVGETLYAVASAGGALYEGELGRGLISFKFREPVENVSILLVLKCANITGRAVELGAPLPLAPIGYAANYTVLLRNLPSEPNIANSTISLRKGFNEEWGHYLRANGSASPGALGFVKLYSYITTPSPLVSRVERTIVVDGGGGAALIDNFTLVGLLNEPSRTLVLTYPSTVRVEGVEGLLGPYPSEDYTVEELDGELKLTIKLRAPPYKAGDRAHVWVKLRTTLKSEDGRYRIPAFLAVGHYVPLLVVRVKVRGSADFYGLSASREWREGEYMVYDIGSFKLVDEEHAPPLSVTLKLAPRHPPAYAIAAAALVAASAAAGYFLRGRRFEERRGAVVEALKAAPELVRVLEERRRLVESLLDSWRRLEEGKLSRHAYRQIYSRLMHREGELRRRAAAMAREYPQAAERLSDFDQAVSAALSRLSRMEELLRRAGRGLIEKREYRRSVAKLEMEVDNALRALEEVIEGLRG